MAEIKCIDVSEWQGNIDFGKVKKSGIDYVVLRAGFGRESSQVDAEFITTVQNPQDLKSVFTGILMQLMLLMPAVKHEHVLK